MSPRTIVAVDFLIHVICRVPSSHHQRSARRNFIRQNDVQVGMTIVRHQIHCLVSKNAAVIMVIEDDGHATMFQCRSARRGLRTFITSNVIWIKIRFPLFVITCP